MVARIWFGRKTVKEGLFSREIVNYKIRVKPQKEYKGSSKDFSTYAKKIE